MARELTWAPGRAISAASCAWKPASLGSSSATAAAALGAAAAAAAAAAAEAEATPEAAALRALRCVAASCVPYSCHHRPRSGTRQYNPEECVVARGRLGGPARSVLCTHRANPSCLRRACVLLQPLTCAPFALVDRKPQHARLVDPPKGSLGFKPVGWPHPHPYPYT